MKDTIQPQHMSVLSDPSVCIAEKYLVCDASYGKGSFGKEYEEHFEVSETALDVVLEWIEKKSAEMEARINIFALCKKSMAS